MPSFLPNHHHFLKFGTFAFWHLRLGHLAFHHWPFFATHLCCWNPSLLGPLVAEPLLLAPLPAVPPCCWLLLPLASPAASPTFCCWSLLPLAPLTLGPLIAGTLCCWPPLLLASLTTGPTFCCWPTLLLEPSVAHTLHCTFTHTWLQACLYLAIFAISHFCSCPLLHF